MSFNPFSVLTSKIFGAAALSLLVLFAVQSCRLERMSDKKDKAEARAAATQLAFDTTVAGYRAAAKAAQQQAEANVARVMAERDAISERKMDELQITRSHADARYRRLLAQAAAADSRRAGDADLSAFADATCRAYAGAACDELPARMKAAQDNTDQLLALQDWVRAQAAVATTPP